MTNELDRYLDILPETLKMSDFRVLEVDFRDHDIDMSCSMHRAFSRKLTLRITNDKDIEAEITILNPVWPESPKVTHPKKLLL